jgi:hypothetical protein
MVANIKDELSTFHRAPKTLQRLLLIVVIVLYWAGGLAPAASQSQIPLGAKLSLAGAGPRLLDGSGLMKLKFSTNDVCADVPLITLDKLPLWSSAGDGWATWLTSGEQPCSFVPMFNSLTANWEIEAYPNQSAMTALGITDLYTLDADGIFTIQPRLLRPAELAALNGTISILNSGGTSQPALSNVRWLSGSVNTRPAGISPPFLIGARVQLPYPCQQGMWPAVWLLNAKGGWPPETDILENVCRKDLGFQLTASMHSNVTGNETRVVDVPWNANGPGYHDYWAVVYNDYTTIFYDGVAVQSFATPPDWKDQPVYMIINYGIAGQNNDWPGPLDPNTKSLPPMKVADAIAMRMPATYGAGAELFHYTPPNRADAIILSGTRLSRRPQPDQ